MKAIDLKKGAGLAMMAALAACVPASVPPAPPPPPPQAAPPPAPPPPQAPRYDNWIDAPQSPGEWRYSADAARSEAAFVSSNNLPLARLRCVRGSRMIVLSLPESGAPSALVTIRTGPTTRTLESQAAGREIIAAFDARDPLLDAMAFTRGRFAIEAQGLAPLYLPSWPEVSRVIEDCR